jgi:hypothetical protein
MSSIRDFLDSVSRGDNIAAQEHIEAAISAKAFDALDAKKQEIAATLFAGHQESSEIE